MKISAVIFDLDGTLIDSEDQWGEAIVKVLKTLGKRATSAHPQEIGVSLRKNWVKILEDYVSRQAKPWMS